MWVNIQRITRAPHCANVVWPDLDSAGTARFSCQIVENNPRLELVREHLDIIAREIVAYLYQDWEITEDPLSKPYLPRLRAVHNRWKLEIEACIIPRVDGTFDASLNIRAFDGAWGTRKTIEEIQKTQTSERGESGATEDESGQENIPQEPITSLDKELLFSSIPRIRRRIVLGYIWDVLLNLLEILVVLAVFSAVRTNFETIVVSALTFIYFGIQFS